MNDTLYLGIGILVMAVTTYLPRVLPLAIFRKKIRNRYLRSFLTYMPYGILAAMIFPAILYSTGSQLSAVCGLVVALVLSYFKKGLLPVALAATATVFLVEQLAVWIH